MQSHTFRRSMRHHDCCYYRCQRARSNFHRRKRATRRQSGYAPTTTTSGTPTALAFLRMGFPAKWKNSEENAPLAESFAPYPRNLVPLPRRSVTSRYASDRLSGRQGPTVPHHRFLPAQSGPDVCRAVLRAGKPVLVGSINRSQIQGMVVERRSFL